MTKRAHSSTKASRTWGLCAQCRWARTIRSDRGSLFVQCGKSFEDPGFAKYPRLPVLVCSGYERAANSPSSE